MAVQIQKKFDVGGIELDSPFKVRRLGHFGINSNQLEASVDFYSNLLGFRISDTVDFTRFLGQEKVAGLGDPKGYFMRHGTDHHSFVVFPRKVYERLASERAGGGPAFPSDVTINQITWQVGSMREVNDAIRWFTDQHKPILRTGRDMPGSNWHMYMPDTDHHVNELYYGIEQIGWAGHSKPLPMRERVFLETPTLPQVSELEEVQQALAQGVDLQSGYRHQETLPANYDVDGILLPRPFKVVRIGPVGLFVHDVAAAERFYSDGLGLTLTERVGYEAHDCAFLRANTEHHSVALYPLELRAQLGLSEHTTLAYIGLQLANYRQLKDAIVFLEEHGCQVKDLPAELHPGIDYAFTVRDPDGHTVQLYSSMEQIGWDGEPSPASERPRARLGSWPETVEARSDSYMGEPYLGPWG